MTKLEKLEFAKKVTEKIKEREDFDIEVVEVPKNNETLIGIKWNKPEEECSPVAYLQNILPDYHNNPNCIKDTADSIIKAFRDAEKNDLSGKRNEIVSIITNWDRCKEKIYLGVVKRAGNEAFLENVIWYPLCDLAVYAFVALPMAEVKITEKMLETFQVTEDVIWETAKENMFLAVEDYKIFDNDNISSILEEEYGEEAVNKEYNILSVVTTAVGFKGAGVIACKNIMDKMCEKYGDVEEVLIMPSSIHEILVAKKSDSLIQYADEIICSVNHEEVDTEEQLSDHVYIYSKKRGLYM